jgi:hypothetical protein
MGWAILHIGEFFHNLIRSHWMEATIMQKRSLNTGCGLGRPGANPTTSEFTTMFNAGIEVGKSFF